MDNFRVAMAFYPAAANKKVTKLLPAGVTEHPTQSGCVVGYPVGKETKVSLPNTKVVTAQLVYLLFYRTD